MVRYLSRRLRAKYQETVGALCNGELKKGIEARCTVHTCNPSTQEAEQAELCAFKAVLHSKCQVSQGYRVRPSLDNTTSTITTTKPTDYIQVKLKRGEQKLG